MKHQKLQISSSTFLQYLSPFFIMASASASLIRDADSDIFQLLLQQRNGMPHFISVFIAIIMNFAAERCDAISRRKRDATAEAGAWTVLRVQAEPEKKMLQFSAWKKKGW
jgi:hypothetical protein